MKKTLFIITGFIVIFLLGQTIISAGQLYSWDDENGVTHITVNPPPENAKNSSARETETPNYKKASGITAPAKISSPIKTVPKQTSTKVELYITSWCPYCKKAVAYFRSKGIPITVYDIEKDRAAAARKNRLTNRRGVPFAVINGQPISGYTPEGYSRALGIK